MEVEQANYMNYFNRDQDIPWTVLPTLAVIAKSGVFVSSCDIFFGLGIGVANKLFQLGDFCKPATGFYFSFAQVRRVIGKSKYEMRFWQNNWEKSAYILASANWFLK